MGSKALLHFGAVGGREHSAVRTAASLGVSLPALCTVLLSIYQEVSAPRCDGGELSILIETHRTHPSSPFRFLFGEFVLNNGAQRLVVPVIHLTSEHGSGNTSETRKRQMAALYETLGDEQGT